jgi:predicted DCC family thiol-disulfide oxidoreductase YuxK
VQFIIKHDKRDTFEFVPLMSEEGSDLLKRHNIDSAEIDSIVLVSGDSAYVKSKAVLKIMKYLGGIWKITEVFGILPDKLLDWLYDITAKNRYKIFGKRKECFLPKSYFNNS